MIFCNHDDKCMRKNGAVVMLEQKGPAQTVGEWGEGLAGPAGMDRQHPSPVRTKRMDPSRRFPVRDHIIFIFELRFHKVEGKIV